MAEVLTGNLSFEKGKWKIEFFDEAKQKDVTLFCQKNVFATDFEPKQEAETKVDFERDTTPQKNAIKVRASGKEWLGKQTETAQVDYSRKGLVQNPDRTKFTRDKGFQPNQPHREAPPMQREFHNPYNFVPAPPRPSAEEISSSALTDEQKGLAIELCDSVPAGHDRYLAAKYSGKLRVKMTTVSPLLVPDAARVQVEELGEGRVHKKFPVRVIDGRPHIESTGVKGMVRSAYESITNSRMAVFSKHEDRLAFRPEAGQGASVVPVRIAVENNVKKVVFYTGSNRTDDLEDNGTPKPNQPICAAWLPRYFNGSVDKYASRYSDETLPSHGDAVDAWVEKFQHYKWRWDKRPNRAKNFNGEGHHQKDFALWGVRRIERIGLELGSKPQVSLDKGEQFGTSYYQPLNEVELIRGVVFVSNHNMQSKHDEKVFFKLDNGPQPEILTEDKWNQLRDEWRNLIENYQELHKDERTPPRNLRIGKWSRHIPKNNEEAALTSGTLCYAQVKKTQKGNLEVERLFPVMISRQLFHHSPWTLLEKDSYGRDLNLTPAHDRDELSPADRVFGFVNRNGQGAYRGQVRIGTVQCVTEDSIEYFGKDNSRNWLPLQILGQPKAQQGRFYVAEDETGKAQAQKRNNEGAGYNAGRGLRGRKVYPHHRQIESNGFWFENGSASFEDDAPDHWLEKFENSEARAYFREYLRPRNLNKQQRDSQNRSIQGWVRKHAEFCFDIHFANLSRVELGALVWLLNLPTGCFHRLGGAKPLGLGSVKLDLIEADCDIHTGAQLTHRYNSLNPDQSSQCDGRDLIDAFKMAVWATYASDFSKKTDKETGEEYQNLVQSEFHEVQFIAAFLRAARGFQDKLPIHYPRARPWGTASGVPVSPHPDGESYKWFVANSKPRHGQVIHGYSLPNLADDAGLPILEEP